MNHEVDCCHRYSASAELADALSQPMIHLNDIGNRFESLVLRDRMVKPFSYAFTSLDPEVLLYQRRVFDRFGMILNQVVGDERHPQAIDRILSQEGADIYVIFDVDAIPLKPGLYERLVNMIGTEHCIAGAEQQCNCNASVNHIYVSPACFCISRETYEFLGKPSFVETYRSDCAEELTHICEERSVPVKFLRKTHSVGNEWRLGPNGTFGTGTTYEGLIYHQFQIRFGKEAFLEKCRKVLESE